MHQWNWNVNVIRFFFCIVIWDFLLFKLLSVFIDHYWARSCPNSLACLFIITVRIIDLWFLVTIQFLVIICFSLRRFIVYILIFIIFTYNFLLKIINARFKILYTRFIIFFLIFLIFNKFFIFIVFIRLWLTWDWIIVVIKNSFKSFFNFLFDIIFTSISLI